MGLCEEIISFSEMLFIVSIHYIKYIIGYQNYYDTVINICNGLINKNIVYAKLLQLDLYRFIDDTKEINEYFKKFCNNCPFEKNNIDFNILNELTMYSKKNNDELIINPNPINSGTIAIVFKGTLNGNPIVLKLLRKDIRNKINIGINTCIMIVRICNIFYKNDTLLNILYKNKQLLLDQTKFLNEINNNYKFQKISEFHDFIKIPKIYSHYTNNISNDIIVMEFLEGKQISDNEDLPLSFEIKEKFAIFIVELYIVHKTVHCDLHIGNIIIIDQNTIGLIDFGLTIDITNEHSQLIVDLFFCIKNSNYNRFLKIGAKMMYNNDDNIQKFLNICNDSQYIKKLLRDNIKINIKIALDMFNFVLNCGLPMESQCNYLVLALISAFSIFRVIEGDNYTINDIMHSFLK